MLAAGLYAGGPRLLAFLVYERSAVLRGEVWRLLTASLVHAGLGHLAWNLAATALVGMAVGPALRARVWLGLSVWVMLASSLGVLLLRPEVRVMAGLSALLHGLLAAGATAQVRRGERWAWLFLGVLAAKVAWEQLLGPAPLGVIAGSGRLAVDAHAYAAASGLLAGLMLSAPGHREPPGPPPAGTGR